MVKKITTIDPWLEPYTDKLKARNWHVIENSRRILGGKSASEFALGHLYFGLHRTETGWVLREWLPNATKVVLVGDFSEWQDDEQYEFVRDEDNWILELPAKTLRHRDNYKLHVYWDGGDDYRLPAYVRYAVQDPDTKIFTAQVWAPKHEFAWTDQGFRPSVDVPLIYEAHVGMSSEDETVASYNYFTRHVLARIKKAGYNTVQLMAIAEHPYYGSFGYHVSNYFAPSSRFGTPDDFRALINTAHGMGLRVIIDIVHSHSVKNETEGLSRQDGTYNQYFHEGERGHHVQWDSRTFDYGKPEVAHFLLSNCRYWLDEFHVDGYRFDGVTSMLYHSHGLEKAFTSYEDYFGGDVDLDALTYLTLANAVVHSAKPEAITIAEDMSAMPGLAAPVEAGGVGFDYRLSMGVPDIWIKTLKHKKDEDWDLAELLYEVTSRRPEEQVISYAESHDQALVGDKTLIFRLADKEIYDHMLVADDNIVIDRATSLHKMIRLLTATAHGGGYLNFMGNEFGHPEWIDFPREGNDWSYKYACRQWNLVDDKKLKYSQLGAFDKAMITQLRGISGDVEYSYVHQDDHVLSYARGDKLIVYNFSPTDSYTEYALPVPAVKYHITLSSDEAAFGGHDRIDTRLEYEAADGYIKLYLPARTALVLTAK
ncbi:alpha amylase C-terminal domain-containing protein [Candidatus Saccharibacteria bacterium]|nr:alpha amylase C-terminal domain-containing protein [Candidatus Saccharibacteria bacterium]